MDSKQWSYEPFRGYNIQYQCFLFVRPFDPKRRVSIIIESFWFNIERLMLLILSKKVFL